GPGLATQPPAVVDRRQRLPPLRHELRAGHVRDGDVLPAHAAAHDPGHGGPDLLGTRWPDDPLPASTSRRRSRRGAGAARVAGGVHQQPDFALLTHPIVAGIQFVVGFYWLYLSTLFDWMGSNHSGHLFMIGHFLISGYIYFWVIIGVDAAPRHISAFNKMLVLFGSVVFHAWFGIALMQMRSPMNADFYQRLDFPFAVDILHDQWVGGAIAWGLGELPLLIVSIAHGVQWYRSEDREAKRYDRHQDRTGGQDLQAYNAMLASMAGKGGDFGEKEYYTADYETESVQSQLHTEKQRRRKQVRRRKGQKFTDLPSPEYGANIPGAY